MRSNILWAGILASTGVAALTTMIIEYLAKPQLEARKERILEHNRHQRTALQGLKRAVWYSGELLSLRDWQSADFWRSRTIKLAGEIAQWVETAQEVIEPPNSLYDDWTTTTAGVEAFQVWAQNAPPTKHVWDEFDKFANHLQDYVHLFLTPRWR